ncbi:MAG: S8 family serine peptidase [bacterium]|nr:S8 family serine peptidase [bacterium]
MRKKFTSVMLVLFLTPVYTVIFISSLSSQNTPDEYKKGELIVKFKPETDNSVVQKSLYRNAMSVKKSFNNIPVKIVKIESGLTVEKAIKNLENDPNVEYAEPNFILHGSTVVPNDQQFGKLWGLNNTGQNEGIADADIDAPEAWDITTGSGNAVVAVIDSGIDYTHEDLKKNVWANPGEIADNGIDDDGNGVIDDVHGYNAARNNGDPMDDAEHGSHVSGTIGSSGNNGIGISGINWKVKIMALKFLEPVANGSTEGLTSHAIECIDYVLDMKKRGINVRVINNSWGNDSYSFSLYDAISALKDEGILFVASAGNDNVDVSSDPRYPASYNLQNIISVAATDNKDQLAHFSNYGSVDVDLGAPGVGILSTVPDDKYAIWDGTSMAAPHVSGVAALLWDFRPELSYNAIKRILLTSGDPVPGLNGKTVTGKRLNAYNALRSPVPPTEPPVVSIGDTQYIQNKDMPIFFDGSSSYDPDGDIVSYAWDFGDSTNITGSESQISHVYNLPGEFKGSLTVMDDENAVSKVEFNVKIIDHKLEPAYGYNNTTTMLTVTSTGNDFDVSSQINIKAYNSGIIGSINTTGTGRRIWVSGNYVYVAHFDLGLQIIDISDPVNPVLKGSFGSSGLTVRGVYVSGNYAYLACYDDGFKIVDISDPASPVEVGSLNLLNINEEVFVSGNYAYVGYLCGVKVIDISNPYLPAITGSIDLPGYDVCGIYVSGNYAYAAVNTLSAGRLDIIDISNPVNPVLTGTVGVGSGTSGSSIWSAAPKGVYISGAYAYLVHSMGLQIIDVIDPGNPAITGGINTPGSAEDVYVSGIYAYIANSTDGLQIVDISNPVMPAIKESVDLPGYTNGVYISGNYVYVSKGYPGGLQVINKASINSSSEPTIFVNNNTLTKIVPAGLTADKYDIKINDYTSGKLLFAAGFTALNPGDTPPAPPVIISLDPNYDSGKAPFNVNFKANAYDPDGTIIKCEWDFDGNGTYDLVSLSNTVSNTYTKAGTFNARVRVTDNDSVSITSYARISCILNKPPSVFLTSNTVFGELPLAVDFKANAYDPDGTIVKYEWDLDGNGIYDSTTVTNVVSHSYNGPAKYNPKVRVTDNDGAVTVASAVVKFKTNIKGNIDCISPGSENRVDGYDLYLLKRAFGSKTGDPDWKAAADINDDAIVNGEDLILLAADFGR